jgi:hypothetical protein
MYILNFKFFYSKLEDKRICTKWYQAFPDCSLLLISSWIESWFVKVVLKYFNSSTHAKHYHQLLYCDFILHSDLDDMTMYLVLSAFTSSPISLLATKKTCHHPIIYYYYYHHHFKFILDQLLLHGGIWYVQMSTRESHLPQHFTN